MLILLIHWQTTGCLNSVAAFFIRPLTEKNDRAEKMLSWPTLLAASVAKTVQKSLLVKSLGLGAKGCQVFRRLHRSRELTSIHSHAPAAMRAAATTKQSVTLLESARG